VEWGDLQCGQSHYLQHTMSHLSANDLKTRGISAIETALKGHSEAIISVRAKERFVVMEMAQYHYLRECELDAAIAASKADIAAGRFKIQTPQEHVDEIMAEIALAD
jgi:predicted transcriptional regulator